MFSDDEERQSISSFHSQQSQKNHTPNSSPDTQTSKQSFIVNLSEREKKVNRNEYINVRDDIKKVIEIADYKKGCERLRVNLMKTDELYLRGGASENAMLDAECFAITSTATKKYVKNLETDRQFDFMQFAERLKTLATPSSRLYETENDEDSQDDDCEFNEWEDFGNQHYHYTKRAPIFQYLYGSFDPEEVTPHERTTQTQRAKRSRLNIDENQIKPEQKVKSNEDEVPEDVELMYQNLTKLCKVNDSEPMNLYQVLVNPDKFSQTVENIFHFAFLVKDNLTEVSEDKEDEQPMIKPIEKANGNNFSQSSTVQSVMSFTMDDWTNWIEEYEIETAAIKPTSNKPSKK